MALKQAWRPKGSGWGPPSLFALSRGRGQGGQERARGSTQGFCKREGSAPSAEHRLPCCSPVMEATEKLRAKCLERGASGIRGLARVFRRLDANRSGTLDADELRRGLEEMGLVLEAQEMEQICKRWDRHGNGTLDLEEFLRALRPPMSQARKDVIAAAFAKLDRSGDGVVTVDDLRGIYSGRDHPKFQSGEWTEDDVFQHFLDNFDTGDKDGQVTAAEFLDYYSGVSASVDTDEEFVAMMTSAWQL
uniref:EF-hand domain-containing protein n=2 Tax=Monodelphis domestica TaxID=13616 RepID=F7FW18_MONDO